MRNFRGNRSRRGLLWCSSKSFSAPKKCTEHLAGDIIDLEIEEENNQR